MGPPHEGSIRRPIAPRANTLTAELHLAPTTRRTMSERSYHGATSRSRLYEQRGPRRDAPCGNCTGLLLASTSTNDVCPLIVTWLRNNICGMPAVLTADVTDAACCCCPTCCVWMTLLPCTMDAAWPPEIIWTLVVLASTCEPAWVVGFDWIWPSDTC